MDKIRSKKLFHIIYSRSIFILNELQELSEPFYFFYIQVILRSEI